MTERELNKLVEAHLPLARKLACDYAEKYYLDEDDVFELALEGFAKAVQSWEPDGGSSFGGYVLRYARHVLNAQCKKMYLERSHYSIDASYADKHGFSTYGRFTNTAAAASEECLISDKEPTCYQSHARRQAWNAIAALLDAREWMILAYHYGLEPLPRLTLDQIGERLHVSKQRVKQIELKAIGKIKKSSTTPRGKMAMAALREYVLVKSA